MTSAFAAAAAATPIVLQSDTKSKVRLFLGFFALRFRLTVTVSLAEHLS